MLPEIARFEMPAALYRKIRARIVCSQCLTRTRRFATRGTQYWGGGVSDKSIFGERYESRIARSIEYVERNLAGPVTLTSLAGIACLSPFHFHRVFHTLTGEPVRAFVERRRLEHAIRLARTRQSAADGVACLAKGGKLIAGGKEPPANPAFARRLLARGCDLGQKKGYFDACGDLFRLDDQQAKRPGTVEKIEGYCSSCAPWSCSWAAQLSIDRKDYRAVLA